MDEKFAATGAIEVPPMICHPVETALLLPNTRHAHAQMHVVGGKEDAPAGDSKHDLLWIRGIFWIGLPSEKPT
jgi:hypothetical protein